MATTRAQTTRAQTARRTGRGGIHEAAAIPIDTSNGRTPDSFPETRVGPKSTWAKQLELLVELHQDLKADLGKFYCIGRFASVQGAQQRMTKMQAVEPKLHNFTFEYQATSDGGEGGGSELWARLVEVTGAGHE